MEYAVALKLLLATFLGGCIGIEREMRDKPAGLRTNILICVGSTLFVLVSTQLAERTGGDQTRIAAQIISGIGFLGAGAVLHAHGFVLGLTTAATIWIVAGVGMALGAGFYGMAVIATAISIVTLTLMSFVDLRLQAHRIYSYSVVVSDLTPAVDRIQAILRNASTSFSGLNFRRTSEGFLVWFNLAVSRETNLKIIEDFSQISEIRQVESAASAHDFTNPARQAGE
jgi:putative Mg2+ transporter-C (MgtC) family protein